MVGEIFFFSKNLQIEKKDIHWMKKKEVKKKNKIKKQNLLPANI